MAVMDEFKDERAKLKDAPLKEKLGYFWYYYKWHVILGTFILILVVSFIIEMATKKDTVFDAAIVNHYSPAETANEYTANLTTYLGIDTKKEEISLDTSYFIDFDTMGQDTVASSEKLVAQAAANVLNVIIADETLFENYVSNDFFADLTTILSEEEIHTYAPYLCYADTESGHVPVGIYIDGCTGFMDTFVPLKSSRSVLGIMANETEHAHTVKFIEYIFDN